ncbi:excinuclease ABC subunit A [Campylobacter sp. faydin G-24]|uniref:Excinuclease ABC subunit A n=1 Tax=Campylobacter anatolicus TaxID=2829105 RepID=A0ABS5HJ70_9BACT|nr:excinuclease ABC subunit A [Campylobacter anatolicus]MBR8463567.1 excinuclease ABC subunit A [Campylobacter anatolicus]
MKFVLVFLLFLSQIFASNLLTYNIYERTDRIDIMLSFDAPYEGNIFQKRERNTTSLILNSLNYDQIVSKSINSSILQELDIKPKQNSLVLNLRSREAIIVNASKTTDGFGLRIRVSPKNTTTNIANIPQASANIQTSSATQTSSESLVDGRYFIVLAVLLALLVFLYVFKKFIIKKQASFGGFGMTNTTTKSINWLLKNKNNEVAVIYEKPLDRLNKLVLLSYENRRYLVLVGSSNVMLDSFGEDKIKNEQDFAAFFEENKKKLGSFLKERQNSLNNYKDKISQD